MSAAKLMGIFKKCLSTQDKKPQVVYFAGSEYDREMTLAREREQTTRSLPPQIGDVMNFPVSVPRSLDGEEGYSAGQRSLLQPRRRQQRHCDSEIEREALQPPPNRTACDVELSPPPPYNARRFTHPPAVGVGGTHRGGDGVRGSTQSMVADRDSKQKTGPGPQQVMNGGGGAGGFGGTRCYNNNGGSLVNNNFTNTVDLNAPGGLPPYHPPYQYHPPHVGGQPPRGGATRHSSGLPQALSTTRGHSRHSSSSSTGSGGSARGALHQHPSPSRRGGDSPPPPYDDAIARDSPLPDRRAPTDNAV